MNQQSKNEEYWRKRVLDDLKYLEKMDADLAQNLRELYQKEFRELQKSIQAFYEKYSENHQISIQEARQRLHHEDLSDYQELANQFYNERNDMSPDVRAERLKRLNQMYETSKAVRMDELLLQTQLQLFAIQAGLEKASNDYLTNIAKQGFDSSFGIPNTPALEQIVKTEFDGKNYSYHIWDNVDRLANNLKDVFTKGFIRGLGSDEMARELRKKLNTSHNQALAVIRTDGTMILNQATIERYKKDGFTRYRDLVTLDMRTSEICKGIKRWNDDHPEGKLMSEAVVGVNIAPYHVNCRTGIIPVETELYDDSHIREIEEMRLRGEINSQVSSGAISKVRGDIYKQEEEFAERFYNQLRNSNRDDVISKMAQSSGLDRKIVSTALKHILDNEYLLWNQEELTYKLQRFHPNFDIAHSLQRLYLNTPNENDIIMLKHENLESYYMNEKKMGYDEAHELTNETYNYQEGLKHANDIGNGKTNRNR